MTALWTRSSVLAVFVVLAKASTPSLPAALLGDDECELTEACALNALQQHKGQTRRFTIANGSVPACFSEAWHAAAVAPSSWMQVLAKSCGSVYTSKALNDVTVIGSHDAAAYQPITNSPFPCGFGLDCEKWFVTQKGSIFEQLNAGSRFFDLRVHWSSKNCQRRKGQYRPACWRMWHPPPKTSVLGIKIPGLDFAALPDVVQDLKRFLDQDLQRDGREVIIVNFKLEQFQGTKVVFWQDKDKTKERLQVLQSHLQAELGAYVESAEASKWWLRSLGDTMLSRRRLILLISAKTSGEADAIRKSDVPWLADKFFEQCKGDAPCSGPIWSAGFPDSCCSVSSVEKDQIRKRKAFAQAVAGRASSDRPLLRLSFQFTGPRGSGNLENVSDALKPELLDFFESVVKQEQAAGPGIYPVANVLSMDFVQDCPSSALAFAVCGSLLPPGTACPLRKITCSRKA